MKTVFTHFPRPLLIVLVDRSVCLFVNKSRISDVLHFRVEWEFEIGSFCDQNVVIVRLSQLQCIAICRSDTTRIPKVGFHQSMN